MKKSRVIPIVITIIIWALMYYNILPPFNIHSEEMWMFILMAVLVGVAINAWTIIKSLLVPKEPTVVGSKRKVFARMKRNPIFILPLAIIVFFAGGILLSSPILRASAYNQILDVRTGDFATDIKEVNYDQIPILDSASAAKIAEREMGSMVDMVSQYEVSSYYNQINYQGKPVRVTPLRYGDLIKWITNRSQGVPAYMRIDMTTQDVDLIKLEDGIRYSPFEHFGRNLTRYVRFRYPTAMIRSVNFEIDEEGVPYWICSVEDKTIGLFGGTDIKGAIIVNAVTGEHVYHNVNETPKWMDKIYDAELLIEQYNYYGTLKKGYINSVFGQRECLRATDGYNYIALDDDVWVYTGVTSIGGDESNVGFVLMNSRTKETNYYQISGAEEYSAMASAQGQVQHLRYEATFPILLNIADEPTYFLALKDEAGLVKKYAMVNIQKYQIVAIGDTVAECEKAYRNLMAGSGIEVVNTDHATTLPNATITMVTSIVADGNTYYYLMLEGETDLFEIEAMNNLQVVKLREGDQISVEYIPMDNGIGSVLSFEKR